MEKEIRHCQNCKKQFVIEPDDFAFYEKIHVSPPTFCPECRFQRRGLWRNERNFYRRVCDLCQRSIVATFSPESKFPVYCGKCWWSDKWDPYQYGQEYDFSKPFFEQFKKLLYEVPMLAMQNDDGVASVNSEYTYDFAFSKNCYMSICGWHCENGMHSFHLEHSKDVLDCSHVKNCELVYGCVTSTKCYNSIYCINCHDCQDCLMNFDLKGCSNCVMCVGLRNKSYCIKNIQYSKEEFSKKISEMNLGSRSEIKKLRSELLDFIKEFPHRYAQIFKSINTTGDVLINCKMAKEVFFGNSVENSKFIVLNDGVKETYDCNNTGHPELCYESVTSDNSYGNIGTIWCWKCNKVEYSNNCHSSEYLLGCSGIKSGSYSILNKKYSPEEFTLLREKIIASMKKNGAWGEFFPAWLSPYAYNESVAEEWFPLSREDALRRGYSWKEPKTRNYSITLKPGDIPDRVEGAADDILDKIIGCDHEGSCQEKCTTAFRLTREELQIYRRMNIPIPDLCPNCRYYERLKIRNPAKLWHRKCTCAGAKSENGIYQNTVSHFHGSERCLNEFQTSYAPERPEIVYCEQCYNSEIV